MAKDGIDVSRWQGQIDWAAVAANRAFAYIKAGGADGGAQSPFYTDGLWGQNRAASGGKLPRGAYYFLAPGDGAAQARHFVSIVGDFGSLELPPALDVEMQGITAAQVETFAATLEALIPQRWTGPQGTPVACIIYSGLALANIFQPSWTRWDLWLAGYYPGGINAHPTVPRPWGAYSIWQWIGTGGRCPGVTGDCDQNVATDEWWTRTLSHPPEDDMTPEQDARLKKVEKTLDALMVQIDPAGVAAGSQYAPKPPFLRQLIEQIKNKTGA